MSDSRPAKRLKRRLPLPPLRRLVCLLVLAITQAGAEAEPVFNPDPGGRLPHPEQFLPWLDEVRMQRRAWEEDLRQRRAERQERIDQERALFRRLGPEPWGVWGPPGPPVPESPPTEHHPGAPPGWDNLWYFRGY